MVVAVLCAWPGTFAVLRLQARFSALIEVMAASISIGLDSIKLHEGYE